MASLHKVRDQGDFDMEAWKEAIRNAVIACRSCQISGRFEDLWEDAA